MKSSVCVDDIVLIVEPLAVRAVLLWVSGLSGADVESVRKSTWMRPVVGEQEVHGGRLASLSACARCVFTRGWRGGGAWW